MDTFDAIYGRRAVKHFDPVHQMQTLMVAAKAMGYESCPMIGFDHDAVAKLINLPDDHCIGPMVAIGKGTKNAWPKPGQLSLSEIVIENRFRN